MKFAPILAYSIRVFCLVVVVSAVVTYVYSLFLHGTGIIDWEISFRLAIIFAIVLPTLREMERSGSVHR